MIPTAMQQNGLNPASDAGQASSPGGILVEYPRFKSAI